MPWITRPDPFDSSAPSVPSLSARTPLAGSLAIVHRAAAMPGNAAVTPRVVAAAIHRGWGEIFGPVVAHAYSSATKPWSEAAMLMVLVANRYPLGKRHVVIAAGGNADGRIAKRVQRGSLSAV